MKDSIVNEIDKFLSRKNYYKKHGILHKRTFLLEGPPGTGKTSLITCLASKYDKNLYLLKFSLK